MYATPAEGLLTTLEVRPLGVDELSSARYVITGAFTRAAVSHYTPEQIAAFSSYVRGPRYADVLLGARAYAAWLGSQMVGLAVFSPGEGHSLTARLLGVYVDPLFAGHGVGTRLIEQVEDAVAAEGNRALEASVTLNAAGFFDHLGYIEVRRGAMALPAGDEMPVVFMRKANAHRAGSTH